MLTRSGAKLLDFGLARLRPSLVAAARHGPRPPAIRDTRAPFSARFPYMAPEQLRGADADARTDLFAFGAMLYEMLTGRRRSTPGPRPSSSRRSSSTNRRRSSTRQPLIPPALERLVATCLAKDPDERWQTAQDLLRGPAMGS